MSNQRTKKDKERRRIVYDFATGKLFLAESDVEISPLIPSSGLSKQASPNGYTIENNVLSLCKASTNGPGLVYALQTNKNLAFGRGSLFSILDGKENSAYGHDAGKRLVEGDKNSLFGFSAASELVEGELNVSFGANSLCTLKKGDANVAFGVFSGDGMVSGSRNVFLGFHARTKKQDISCGVVIGYNAVGEKSNELLISDQIHSFRMRGLESEPWSHNTSMVCYDENTGLIAPIRYPSRVKGPKHVEHDTIKKLLRVPVCCDVSGSAFVELEEAKNVPGITTKNKTGQVSGINHPNLIMTILAASQELREDISLLKKRVKKESQENSTETRLHDLEMKLGKDIELKRELSVLTEKMGKLPTENSESIERLHQKFVKLEKKLLDFIGQNGEEKEALSKLSERVDSLLFLEDARAVSTKQELQKLSLENERLFENLSKAEEENKKLCQDFCDFVRESKEKFSCLTKEMEEKIALLQEQNAELMKKQAEEFTKLLQQKENRPVSPLLVTTNGDLRRRVVPIDKMFDDWENIS